MQRYFGNKDNEFLIDDADIHHIKNVMRGKVGDEIEVIVDNKLILMEAKSLEPFSVIEKKVSELKKTNLPKICLAQALVREQKWNLILQKGTELGVSEFMPLSLERCNVKIDSKKIDKKYLRWNLICKEASEQSFRSEVPKIFDIKSLEELSKMDYSLKLICSTKSESKYIKKILQNSKKCDSILIVVGPEGGLTSFEEEIMIEAGFIPVSLGTNILRTETAGFVTLSVINYEFRSD